MFHLITNLFAKSLILRTPFKSSYRLLENLSKQLRKQKKKEDYSLVYCMLISIDYLDNFFGVGS